MKELVILFVLILALSQLGFVDKLEYLEEQPVSLVLEKLGDPSLDSNKVNFGVKDVSAIVGEDIVIRGSSDREGLRNSGRQSKHFECIACHNIQKEDPDLSISDPQDRLIYTSQKGIPFLQGTTLYGVVNRTRFYNDDYYKKYGDLVTDAKRDIRASIQLCATECSQGRALKDWELESVLAYLWTIELKMSDLNWNAEELEQIHSSMEEGTDVGKSLQLIKSKYLEGSPAHFVDKPNDLSEGYPQVGDSSNGKLIYDNSCLHCHYKEKYSFFNLDHSKMTFGYLKRKADNYSDHSIYQVIRYGTYPKYGNKSYMPQYTRERMNNQQVEDLRAYIELMAN